jgi:hypothetical protein
MVRAGGLEPPRGYPQRIFVPATAFAAPPKRSEGGFVVWTIPSPCPAAGFRCCPSSLYTFPFPGLARDCHCRFPRLWAVLRPRFPAAHSNVQVRCVCHSATPAWRHSYSDGRAGRQADRNARAARVHASARPARSGVPTRKKGA